MWTSAHVIWDGESDIWIAIPRHCTVKFAETEMDNDGHLLPHRCRCIHRWRNYQMQSMLNTSLVATEIVNVACTTSSTPQRFVQKSWQCCSILSFALPVFAKSTIAQITVVIDVIIALSKVRSLQHYRIGINKAMQQPVQVCLLHWYMHGPNRLMMTLYQKELVYTTTNLDYQCGS